MLFPELSLTLAQDLTDIRRVHGCDRYSSYCVCESDLGVGGRERLGGGDGEAGPSGPTAVTSRAPGKLPGPRHLSSCPQGRLTFKNGRVYEGRFHNDHMALLAEHEAEVSSSCSFELSSDASARCHRSPSFLSAGMSLPKDPARAGGRRGVRGRPRGQRG